MKLYKADEQKGYPASKIGPLIERIFTSPNPKLHYSFGRIFQSLVPFLKRVTPQRLAQWIFCLMYKT